MGFKKSISSTIAVIAMFFSSMCFAQISLTEGGASGSWYNLARDGEGIFVEIVKTGGVPRISVAWFTYDQQGFQMWLSGAGELTSNQTTVTLSVQVTNGPKFGSAYNPLDLIRQDWGTITLAFNTCGSGVLSYASSVEGFGTGGIDLSRLTNLEQVRCTEPPPPVGAGIAPGKWQGPQVCFFVAPDGRTLTSEGSTCEGGNAFVANIDSMLEDGGACVAEVECRGVIAIVDGSFSCTGDSDENQIAVGSFWNPTNAAGTAQETESSGVCTAQWKAVPQNP
jgi:hypothetical protein